MLSVSVSIYTDLHLRNPSFQAQWHSTSLILSWLPHTSKCSASGSSVTEVGYRIFNLMDVHLWQHFCQHKSTWSLLVRVRWTEKVNMSLAIHCPKAVGGRRISTLWNNLELIQPHILLH